MKTAKLFLASAVCASMLLAGCSKNGGEDQPKTYTITVTSGDNGTAVADKTTAAAGATVTLTTTPDNGYAFDKWIVESGGAILPPNATVFTMPADNVRIKAEFAAIEYAVTVTPGDNGTAETDKESAAEGAIVKLTAAPDPGCEFVKWTVESGDVELSSTTANPATFVMPAGDVKVQAEFSKGVLINGVVWAPCNVDAPGTFAAKPEDSGMYYQWNRKTGWNSSDPATSSPAGATWNSTDADGDEWAAENDPCPAGWRVPTKGEYVALCEIGKTTNEWTTLSDVYGRWFTDEVSGNSVFFPASGYRASASGAPSFVGSYGRYWSATPSSAAYARILYFNSGTVDPQVSNSRATGFAVRCVAK